MNVLQGEDQSKENNDEQLSGEYSEGDVSMEIPAYRQASYELKTNLNALDHRKTMENLIGKSSNLINKKNINLYSNPIMCKKFFQIFYY